MSGIDSFRRTFLKLATATGGALAFGTSPTLASRSISYGDTISGNITEEDPTDPKYESYYTEPVTFHGESGDGITVTLSFDDADPWIRVVGPDGNEIINGDTSEASATLSESGQHTIYPQAYPQETPGEYTLTLAGEDNTTDDDTDSGEDTVTESVSPDSPYVVETKALGASPTRAIFSMKINPQPEALGDYEPGTVSGLQLSVSGGDVHIARMTPLPDENGNLFSATGSVLLGTMSLLGGPVGAAATVASLATGSLELTKEVQKHNLEEAEGTKSAVFTGNPFGGMEFLSDSVKYLVEVESTAGQMNEDDAQLGTDWDDAIVFSYRADPDQLPSSTEIPPKAYTPTIEGDLSDDEPFVDHVE